MKTGIHSRTNILHLSGALAGVVFALAAAFAPGKVSAELAASIASLVMLAFAGRGAYLKADDRKKAKRTAADMLASQTNAKAAKAAARVGMLLLLAGCDPHWQLCEVDLSNHPTKQAPAASARVRCSRTVLCDVAEGVVCDGKKLAEVGK